jgi:hypothetical protein
MGALVALDSRPPVAVRFQGLLFRRWLVTPISMERWQTRAAVKHICAPLLGASYFSVAKDGCAILAQLKPSGDYR